jgi:hypothetical protein
MQVEEKSFNGQKIAIGKGFISFFWYYILLQQFFSSRIRKRFA